MASSNIQLAQSADGSWTCFNAAIGEHYHNLRGAFTEAQSVYITPTNLRERLQKNLHLTILDPFLGLGYNTLALMDAFQKLKQTEFPDATLTVIAIESDPEILRFIPRVLEDPTLEHLKSFLPLFEHNIYYQTQIKSKDDESESLR